MSQFNSIDGFRRSLDEISKFLDDINHGNTADRALAELRSLGLLKGVEYADTNNEFIARLRTAAGAKERLANYLLGNPDARTDCPKLNLSKDNKTKWETIFFESGSTTAYVLAAR